MLETFLTSTFRKDYKLMKKRGYNMQLLDNVIKKLCNNEILDEKYHDHALTGNFTGFRECHIKSDWLLIYKIDNGKLLLILSQTGTHADLFGK